MDSVKKKIAWTKNSELNVRSVQAIRNKLTAAERALEEPSFMLQKAKSVAQQWTDQDAADQAEVDKLTLDLETARWHRNRWTGSRRTWTSSSLQFPCTASSRTCAPSQKRRLCRWGNRSFRWPQDLVISTQSCTHLPLQRGHVKEALPCSWQTKRWIWFWFR